jgi:hypothetical protein
MPDSLANGPSPHRRRRMFVSGGLVVLVLLAGTAFAIHTERARNATVTVPYEIITPSGGSFYMFRRKRSTITVTAPAESAINLRTVFWPTSARRSTDQESCIDWTTPDGRAQPGMALRIVSGEANNGKAILLTQNVFAQIYFEFYVLGVDHGEFVPKLGQFDMRRVVWTGTRMRPGPWHVCARVIGRRFSIKLWLPGQPEPSWDSTGPEVRHLMLPATWVYPGLPGAYIGHIKPNQSFVFEHQTSRSLDGR